MSENYISIQVKGGGGGEEEGLKIGYRMFLFTSR